MSTLINHVDYKYLQGSNEPWYYISCCSNIFPFGTLTNRDFIPSITNSLSQQRTKNENDNESLLSLKPLSDLALLYNQFNNTSPEKNDDPVNVVNSKYYDMDKVQTLKLPSKHKSLVLFHINACSLNKNFDDPDHLLKCTNKVFDIVAVTETRITKQTSLATNINLRNYAIEFTPTESSAGGTLLYIANHLPYKPRPDLNIYKANQLESTFVEIINPKKSSIVIGCPYKHPNMDVFYFKSNYLSQVFEIVSKERKQVFLLGDININLLNYNDHQPTSGFLDSLASNSFIRSILHPTRITSHSKTLIDNIFSNFISPEIISGNITATISDHLPQFSFVPNILSNPSTQKSNYYERGWSKFKQENFILDYFDKDWADLLRIDEENVNLYGFFFKQYKLYLGCTCSIKKN